MFLWIPYPSIAVSWIMVVSMGWVGAASCMALDAALPNASPVRTGWKLVGMGRCGTEASCGLFAKTGKPNSPALAPVCRIGVFGTVVLTAPLIFTRAGTGTPNCPAAFEVGNC